MIPAVPIQRPKASSDHPGDSWHPYLWASVVLSIVPTTMDRFISPEKLIHKAVSNVIDGKASVYGKEDVRDWLYVEDHARAIDTSSTGRAD